MQKNASMHVTFLVASMHYVETTWLAYKERIVAALLRNKRHYGHITTSRVESAHAALKNGLLCQRVSRMIRKLFSLAVLFF